MLDTIAGCTQAVVSVSRPVCLSVQYVGALVGATLVRYRSETCSVIKGMEIEFDHGMELDS